MGLSLKRKASQSFFATLGAGKSINKKSSHKFRLFVECGNGFFVLLVRLRKSIEALYRRESEPAYKNISREMIHVSNCAIYENAISTAFALENFHIQTTGGKYKEEHDGKTTPAHCNINNKRGAFAAWFSLYSFILTNFNSYQFDNE